MLALTTFNIAVAMIVLALFLFIFGPPIVRRIGWLITDWLDSVRVLFMTDEQIKSEVQSDLDYLLSSPNMPFDVKQRISKIKDEVDKW